MNDQPDEGFVINSEGRNETYWGPSPPPGASDLTVGDVVAGRYEVRALLGQGGMGCVYRVYDRELDTDVALKTIRHEADDAAVARFRAEVKRAREVTHPNVVPTYDIGSHEGMLFITMAYVQGRTLAAELHNRRQRNEKPDAGFAVQVVASLCDTLAEMHARGVIHRDLKPDNILLASDGRVMIMDFGLAKGVYDGLTERGVRMGTPEYMPPEQRKDASAADERSDIYALGVILFELLTLHTPGAGASLAKEPIPGAKDFQQVFFTCCAFRADERYASVDALKEALGKIRVEQPSAPHRKTKRRTIGCTVAVVLGLAIPCGLFALHTMPQYPPYTGGASGNQEPLEDEAPEASCRLTEKDSSLIAEVTEVYKPGSSESDDEAKETVEDRARKTAREAIRERLATKLEPGEKEDLATALGVWSNDKVAYDEVSFDRPEGANWIAAGLTATTDLEGFQEYVEAVRGARVPDVLADKELAVDFGFYRRAESGAEPIKPGGEIRTGDRFWIEAEATQDCYLYVINEDAKGNLLPMYPRVENNYGSFVKAGRRVTLPGEHHEYRANEVTGKEKVYVIASLAPLTDIEYFAKRYPEGAYSETDRKLFEERVRSRGFDTVERVETASQSHEAPLDMERIAGKGTWVHEVEFDHR